MKVRTMIIIPAIDLKDGKCVRLTQGRFDAIKTYSDEPVKVAKKWEKDGARYLHIVDLDGARTGELANFETIKQITNAVKIPIQVGGGIYSIEIAEKLVSARVDRIILGSVALENEPLLKKLLEKYPEKIVVSLDAKNGNLMIKGWQESTRANAIDAALELEALGVRRFIYTDVTKDGTLTSPNYMEIKNLVDKLTEPVIAAGGISSLVAVRKLKQLGVEGAILGKALYEGKINLGECIAYSK